MPYPRTGTPLCIPYGLPSNNENITEKASLNLSRWYEFETSLALIPAAYQLMAVLPYDPDNPGQPKAGSACQHNGCAGGDTKIKGGI